VKCSARVDEIRQPAVLGFRISAAQDTSVSHRRSA
jgi:hypothetical protein